MPPFEPQQGRDPFQDYCQVACQQVRWQKMRPALAQELQAHLEDQRDAYLAQGLTPEQATSEAIRQMGDPVQVGQGLDQSHRPKPQWPLIALTLALLAAGALGRWLAVAVAGGQMAQYWQGSEGWLRLLLPCLLGLGVFGACYLLDVSFLGRYPKLIYCCLLAFSLLGLFNAAMAGSAHYWVLGRVTVSMRLVTLAYPLAFGLLVYGLRGQGYRGLLLAGLGYLALAGVAVAVPSAAGLLLLSLAALVLLVLAVVKGWFAVERKTGLLLVLVPAAVLVAAFLFGLGGHMWQRLAVALQPGSDAHGAGYVGVLVRQVVAGASFIGQGTLPAGYPLESLEILRSDYLLTLLLYRLGWLPVLVLLGGFIAFMALAFWQLQRQKSVLGTIVGLTVLLTFAFQVLTYCMGCLGFGVFAGLSLPLVSFGNSGLIINLALIGFMLSVFRNGEALGDRANRRRLRWRLRLVAEEE